MPCHHHPHHPSPPHTACCCSAASSCCCCCSNSSSSNPSLNTSDQLLQAVAKHLLLLQSQTPSPPPTHLHQHLQSQYPLHHSLYQKHHQTDDHHLQQQQAQQFLLQSLHRRIADIESSIHHISSPPHPSFSPSPPVKQQNQPSAPPSGAYSSSSSLRPSLRDLAARTIQAAFRRFLVHRSQTLRHLKDLATIKSHVAALKSAVSDKTHQEPKVLSERGMDLLLRLDSIQSGDPMIREGKRSISRELVRILDFIEKVLLRELQLALEAEDNGGAFLEDLSRNERVAWARPKKVSFLENEKGLRASCNWHGPLAEESSDANDEIGHVESLGMEFAGVELGDHPEPQVLPEVSDNENSSNASLVENGGGRYMVQNGKKGLSAPLPVQMESRRK